MAPRDPRRWTLTALGGLLVALGGALWGRRGAAKPTPSAARSTPVRKPPPGIQAAQRRKRQADARVRGSEARAQSPQSGSPLPRKPPAPPVTHPPAEAQAPGAGQRPLAIGSTAVGYELRDTRASTLAIIMVVSVLIIAGSIAGLFGLIGRFRAEDRRTPPLTTEQQAFIAPPEPRLQDHPFSDIAAERKREEGLLSSYAWNDGAHTRARIPIGRAAALVIGRPLDSTP